MDHHVERTAVHPHNQGVGIGDNLERHVFQMGLRSPVSIKACHFHTALRDIGNKAERTGTDRSGSLLISGICRDDCRCHGVKKFQAGFREGYYNSSLVIGIHAGHIGKCRHQRDSVIFRTGTSFQ